VRAHLSDFRGGDLHTVFAQTNSEDERFEHHPPSSGNFATDPALRKIGELFAQAPHLCNDLLRGRRIALGNVGDGL
jgi:hypothetical protein